MSYDVTSWKTKKIDSLQIPTKELYEPMFIVGQVVENQPIGRQDKIVEIRLRKNRWFYKAELGFFVDPNSWFAEEHLVAVHLTQSRYWRHFL